MLRREMPQQLTAVTPVTLALVHYRQLGDSIGASQSHVLWHCSFSPAQWSVEAEYLTHLVELNLFLWRLWNFRRGDLDSSIAGYLTPMFMFSAICLFQIHQGMLEDHQRHTHQERIVDHQQEFMRHHHQDLMRHLVQDLMHQDGDLELPRQDLRQHGNMRHLVQDLRHLALDPRHLV